MSTHLKISKYFVISAALFAIIATGCQKNSKNGRNGSGSSGDESNMSADRDVDLSSVGKSKGECSLATVYFDFDSSELDSTARQAVEGAVECYRKKNASVRLHLTGAADPQGTEEYNLALGERRAQAVQK